VLGELYPPSTHAISQLRKIKPKTLPLSCLQTLSSLLSFRIYSNPKKVDEKFRHRYRKSGIVDRNI
jgi:hypothetical protein